MLRTIALVSMLLALVVVLGCPRTPPPPPPTVTPTVPGTTPPGADPNATTLTPTLPAGEMGEIVKAHNLLSNYEVTITTDKKVTLKAAVKLEQGKPVALRVEGPKGYTLVKLSEEAMFLVDPKAKTAVEQTLGTKGAAYALKLPSPRALAAKSPEVKSSKLGELECWYLTWTDMQGDKTEMWMDKKDGLPQKALRGKSVTKYAYSKIGAVPEAAFEVPTEYAVKELKVEVPVGAAAPTATPPATATTPPAATSKPRAAKPGPPPAAPVKPPAAKAPATSPGLTPAP